MPTLPVGGQCGANVAFNATVGSVLRTPMQLGPIMRMPARRTNRVMRSWVARPSGDASAKPAEITTTARPPAAAHSWTVDSTAGAGTAITARSTGAPIALTDGYVRAPSISAADGLTG